MNTVIFGASGMVGGAVLLECLADPEVERVLVVGRASCGVTHSKLRELITPDLFDLGAVAGELGDYDACLYCVGVSAAGMSEADYRRVTLEMTVAVVEVLQKANPSVKVCFVSGKGTDGTGRSRMMWARVKGEAENWLLSQPIEAYMFRPGFIQPLKGVRSKVKIYNALYTVLAPVSSLLGRVFPNAITTSVDVGRAMILTARNGYPNPILEPDDIRKVAGT